jgi:hypothetical protein
MEETLQVVMSSVPVAMAVFKSANEIAPLSVTPLTVQAAMTDLLLARIRSGRRRKIVLLFVITPSVHRLSA